MFDLTQYLQNVILSVTIKNQYKMMRYFAFKKNVNLY